SRVWLPTTSPASTCFASTTPAIGLRTVAYPIRVRSWSSCAVAAAYAVRSRSYSGSVITLRSRSCSARWNAASATWKPASAAASCASSSRWSTRARIPPSASTSPSSTSTESRAPEVWLFTPTVRIGSTTPETVTPRETAPVSAAIVSTGVGAAAPPRPPPGPPAAPPSPPHAAIPSAITTAAAGRPPDHRPRARMPGAFETSDFIERFSEYGLEPRDRAAQLLARPHGGDFGVRQRHLGRLQLQDGRRADLVPLLLHTEVLPGERDRPLRDLRAPGCRFDVLHGRLDRDPRAERRVQRHRLGQSLLGSRTGQSRLALEAVEERVGSDHAEAPALLPRRKLEGRPVVAAGHPHAREIGRHGRQPVRPTTAEGRLCREHRRRDLER